MQDPHLDRRLFSMAGRVREGRSWSGASPLLPWRQSINCRCHGKLTKVQGTIYGAVGIYMRYLVLEEVP